MEQAADLLVKIPVKTFEHDQHVVAWIFVPDQFPPRSVVFCVPGGTFSKLYYHPDVGGAAGYSMAAFLRERGHLVVALDNLGVGDSSRPVDGAALDKTAMADANAQAVAFVVDHLRAGTLSPNLPVMGDIPVVGVGHSMGGLSSVVLQAKHGSFDALAVLGWTNQQGTNTGHDRPIAESYTSVSRDSLRPFFHCSDVPESVMAADDRHVEPIPSGMLRDAGRDGVTAVEAAKIAVPVFICFGEFDLCPTPHLEPATYMASRDVTLLVLQGSAHNQNFAATRQTLFQRLANWIDGVVGSN